MSDENTTVTVSTGLHPKSCPVAGFARNSPQHLTGKYEDVTVWEREKWMEAHPGQRVPVCQATHPDGNHGKCTRVKKHNETEGSDNPEPWKGSGHWAGDGDIIIAIWG